MKTIHGFADVTYTFDESTHGPYKIKIILRNGQELHTVAGSPPALVGDAMQKQIEDYQARHGRPAVGKPDRSKATTYGPVVYCDHGWDD